MRVSDSMLGELNLTSIDRARADLAEAQRTAQTGVEVEKPSDDPVKAALARSSRSLVKRTETLERLSADARSGLEAVDQTLAAVNNAVTRARELAVQGANDSVSAADRANLATEVRSLRSQLLDLANTQVNGEFIFGGLETGVAPYDALGAYQGSSAVRQLEVGVGLRVDTQVPGDQVFGSAGTGVNAFDTLEALAVALEADDATAVSLQIDQVAAVGDQIANAQARVGGQMDAVSQAGAIAARTKDNAVARTSRLTEADTYEAFSELVRAEAALERAISVAARIPPSGLLDTV